MPKTTEAQPVSGELLELRYVLVQTAINMQFERNPKKHDIGKLCTSIAEYGFRDPPAFDVNLGQHGGIVYGNGRVEALALMERDGWELPRGIGLAEDGAWVMPVMFGCDAKSKAAAEAFVIDHNNLTMAGGEFTALDMSRMYNMEEYLALLDGIRGEDPDEMPATVDLDDLTLMFEAAAGAFGDLPTEDPDDAQAVADAAASNDYVPRVQEGEIWKLGRHYIACADCTDDASIRLLMDEAGVEGCDCCWTDPPYGVSYEGRTEEAMTIQNDSLNKEQLFEFLCKVFESVKTACKPGSPCYVAHPANELHSIFYNAIVGSGLVFKQTLVWVKNTFVMGRSDYHYQHEPIYYAYTPGGGKPSRMWNGDWYGEHNQTSVFFFDKPNANRLHRGMKPVGLVATAINNSIPPRGIVFEPFLGSGTTLVAAEENGFTCIGTELNPKYASAVVDRWEKLTGGKAEKVGHV